MMKKLTTSVVAFAAMALLSVSCGKDDAGSYTPTFSGEVDENVEAYMIATRVGDYYYYLAAESLKSGSETVKNNGAEGKSITEYSIIDNMYMYTVADGGGANPAPVYAYYLDAATGRIKCDMTKYYSTVKYEAWGQVDGNFVHLAPITHTVDETPYVVEAVAWENLTAEQQALTSPITSSSLAGSYEPYYIGYSFSEAPSSQYVAADNFLGTGETVTFSGFAEAGDYVYVAVVPMYTLPWAVNEYRSELETLLKDVTGDNDANLDDYIAYGYGSQESLTATNTAASDTTVSTWSNAYKPTAGIPFPISVDRVYVAVYDKSVRDFANTAPIKIIEDDRMGASLCRRVRNPRPAITTGANGDVYVFSTGGLRKTDDAFAQYYTVDAEGNYINKMNDLKVIKGENGGSVMRIKAGETKFDETFGVMDIEEKIKNLYGNYYAFTRVFYIGGSKFLIRVMDADYSISGGKYVGCYNTSHHSLFDTRFAVLDVDSGSLTAVTGLPEGADINSGSASGAIHDPFCEDGVAYIPVSLSAGGSAVYYFDTNDTTTYTAQQGVKTDADYIQGLGKMKGLIYK